MKRGDKIAFPMMPSHTDPKNVHPDFAGLTVREYFAAKAMQGLLAQGQGIKGGSASGWTPRDLAIDSRKIADALIDALE